ncbi:MAG: hypothetical protein ACOH10_15085 [Rhodoglobus sp.]
MLTVIIPWREQPTRISALNAVRDWYLNEIDDVDFVLVDSHDGVFNLSQARNLGVASITDPHRVVVINDADTIPQRDSLLHAVDAAANSGLVHLPYTEYHWLGAPGSAQFAAGAELDDCEFELVRGACSGVYVTTPQTWVSHGAQDERFRGWGFEDAAWYLAHSTLLGEPPRRSDGRVFALHHAAQPREGDQYDANAALMERYKEAAGDVAAMRALVDGSAAASASNALTLPGD